MSRNIHLSEFEPNDLLSFESYRDERFKVKEEKIIRMSHFTSKLYGIWNHTIPQSFSQALIDGLDLRLLNIHEWFREGVDCAVLKLGSKSWCKGKIKISIFVEFIPDPTGVELQNEKATDEQAESPLDEIRQMMNDKPIDEWS